MPDSSDHFSGVPQLTVGSLDEFITDRRASSYDNGTAADSCYDDGFVSLHQPRHSNDGFKNNSRVAMLNE